MKSIIGLFRGEDDPTQSVQRLKEAGLPEGRITIFTQENAIRKFLGCEPTCVVSRYAVWGASIGIAVYALFALFAGLCQCDLFHFDQAHGIATILGGILAGGFVGGALGLLVGAGEFEKDSHLYVQGARMGGSVIVVQASEEDADRLKLVLEQEKVLGVKAL
jgi:hypothetical protein